MNAAGPWIPVSERLPELSGDPDERSDFPFSADVLIYQPQCAHEISVGYLVECMGSRHWETADDIIPLGEVTHWAPLVAPEVSP